MAYSPNQKPSAWQNLGQKVHQGLELASTAKAIWDTGKMIYTGIRAAALFIEGIMSTAALR